MKKAPNKGFFCYFLEKVNKYFPKYVLIIKRKPF